jgi:GT2 family glycosyltransferase
MTQLSVIMASHNRAETTVRCLDSLRLATEGTDVSLRLILFDDGSSDDTVDAISFIYPEATVLHGDGNCFWAKSMSLAEKEALAERPSADYILWLNDDVVLEPSSVTRLLTAAMCHPDSVICGAVRSENDREVTYSGLVSAGKHPLRLRLVEPDKSEVIPVDTFNGNIVLVPSHIASLIGGIDGEYSHALADIDYGFRCSRARVPVLLAPATYGICERNPVQDQSQPISRQWKSYVGVKGGGNFRSLARILRKTRPWTWPLYLGGSYALWWLRTGVKLARARCSN